MNLLSTFFSSTNVQFKVKFLSLSLIGLSAVAGITCEELSGAKISGLLSKLEGLIPWEDLRGGQEVGEGINAAFSGFGTAVSEGAQGLYWLGSQLVSYFPRAILMIDSLFQTGMKYATESESMTSKWGSVYSIVKTKDTTTVINNWIMCLIDLERLWSLIKLPIKIFMTLNKVELNINPRVPKLKKPKPPKPVTKGEEIWTKKDDGICWECFGIVLLRPRKSLKELRQSKKDTWTINPL